MRPLFTNSASEHYLGVYYTWRLLSTFLGGKIFLYVHPSTVDERLRQDTGWTGRPFGRRAYQMKAYLALVGPGCMLGSRLRCESFST